MIGSQGYYEFISGVEADESLPYATVPIDERTKAVIDKNSHKK
ncbi:MAG: hypothetical protein ACLS5X_00670 [Eubacterium sp.]